MLSLFKNTKVVGGIIAVVVLGLGYYYWSNSGSSDSAAVVQTDATSAASQDLLTLLGSLHSIQLDDSIFKDPNFIALSDFGVTIPPQASGRPNPFAPVGFQSSSGPTPPAQAGQ